MPPWSLRWVLLIVCLIGLFGFTPTLAQTPSATCSQVAKQAVQDLGTTCQGLLPGHACYGHKMVETTFADENQKSPFANPGDQIGVNTLKVIHTLSLDLTTDQLGTVAINFVDDTSKPPATPVATALLFGDVTLKFAENAAPQNSTATPSFYFRAAFGDPTCEEAQSQFVIHNTVEKPVSLSINGADLTLNALAAFRAQSANSISVTVYQGTLEIAHGPTAQAGQTLVAVVDNDGTVVMWSAPRSATQQETTALVAFSQLSGPLAAFVGGCTSDNTHVVASGENLFRIALRYKTSVNTLMTANHLTNANLIQVGQRLRIPCDNTRVSKAVNTPQPAVAKSPAVACNTAITVTPNDTLSQIAARYHTTIPAIMAANNLTDPNLIQAGQRLWIPCGNTSVSVTKAVNTPQPAIINATGGAPTACNTVIILMPFDDLSRIAQRYQTTLPAILSANNLTDSQMPLPGQSLIIPCN